MPYMLVRHKVGDIAKWRPAFDEHASVRREAGFRGAQIFKNVDDPHEVITLFEVQDVERAREFCRSEDLRRVMQRAGVTDRPDVFLLEEEGKTTV